MASELILLPSYSFPLSPSSLSTDNCRFRQLIRLNSLFRTRHSNVVLQQCFLLLVFVPIPVCLRSFRLSPGSARKMTPGHVPWPSLRPEQTVWSSLFQFHGLCLCASPVVSQRSTSGRQTLLSTWRPFIMLCSSCAPCFLQVGLA